MSSVNSKIAKNFTSLTIVLISITGYVSGAMAWEVDFTRRQVEFNSIQNNDRLPASVNEDKSVSILTSVFESTEPTQDIVIMNTEKGFVPEVVRLRKNGNYKIHIVNVNKKEKNVSFILDAFSEHHNTIFGEEKTFSVSPKTDGIFSYQCPETAVQGKFIIFSESERKPASN